LVGFVCGDEAVREPFDARIRRWIEIPKIWRFEGHKTDGSHRRFRNHSGEAGRSGWLIVNAEITFRIKDGDAVGRWRRSGPSRHFGVDVEIVIRKHHIPHRFGPDVLDRAQRIGDDQQPNSRAGEISRSMTR
jgi:ribonuclease R